LLFLANEIIDLVNMSSYNEFASSFETNVFGPIKVTRAVLPHMRANKSGTMVFISSLSGWIGHQFTGAYAGSKFALEGRLSDICH
jgi:NAD(P)-dependent dehydrogenase (short-subunit alcohol dehydrogenase family)